MLASRSPGGIVSPCWVQAGSGVVGKAVRGCGLRRVGLEKRAGARRLEEPCQQAGEAPREEAGVHSRMVLAPGLQADEQTQAIPGARRPGAAMDALKSAGRALIRSPSLAKQSWGCGGGRHRSECVRVRRGPGLGVAAHEPRPLRGPGLGREAGPGPAPRGPGATFPGPAGLRVSEGHVPPPAPILCDCGGGAEAGGRNGSSGSPGAAAGRRRRLARPGHVPSLDSQGRQELCVRTRGGVGVRTRGGVGRGGERTWGGWGGPPTPRPCTLARGQRPAAASPAPAPRRLCGPGRAHSGKLLGPRRREGRKGGERRRRGPGGQQPGPPGR